jgi:hypothetical protein
MTALTVRLLDAGEISNVRSLPKEIGALIV